MSAHSITSRGLAGRKIPQGTLTPMGALLFSASEQGAWYDPSDLSTLFQDAAGATPVTAMEQPVGLILDKSQGLVLGPELVTGGGFDDPAKWTSSTWTVSAGVATYPDTINDFIRPANANLLPLVAGKFYRVRFTLSGVTGSAVCAVANADGSVAYTAITTFTTDGEKQFIIYAAASTTNVRFYGYTTSGGTWSLDDFSIKELPGNHASQATTTKRGVVSRRVNLLTKTEQFDDAVWVINTLGGANCTKAANATVAPNGTLTAALITSTGLVNDFIYQVPSLALGSAVTLSLYLKNNDTTASSVMARTSVTSLAVSINWAGSVLSSITLTTGTSASFVDVGSGWYKVSLSFTTGEANPFIRIFPGSGQSLYVWGASLVLSIDAHLPYQWVNTPTDYDADPAKFPAYLRFDGVDDALQTGNINFTGTGNVTVWAGITKLSDAATGMLTELSPAGSSGSFYVAAPQGAAATYNFRAGGSTLIAATSPANYAAPITSVLTGIDDISGDSVILRINGSQVAATALDQGAGNYGNYPLYIGARGGTSLFFNGRLYQLIVRGAQSSLSQLEAGELLTKSRMKLP